MLAIPEQEGRCLSWEFWGTCISLLVMLIRDHGEPKIGHTEMQGLHFSAVSGRD